jgi:hypothetical protein
VYIWFGTEAPQIPVVLSYTATVDVMPLYTFDVLHASLRLDVRHPHATRMWLQTPNLSAIRLNDFAQLELHFHALGLSACPHNEVFLKCQKTIVIQI